jgi:hypothetical protein
MEHTRREDDLWDALELAVRTYQQELPVDSFLPPPDQRAWKQPVEKKEAALPDQDQEPAAAPGDDYWEPMVEELEIEMSCPTSEDNDSLDDELRNQLSGKSLAELDDV